MREQRITGNAMLHMNWTLRCFMQTDSHKKEETRSQKRSLGSARDDDTGKRTLSHSLSYRCEANLRPFGAPPSKGRRECNSSPASSFRANARNLFRSRSRKDVGAGNGKHRAPCESGSRCFMQTDSRMKKKMANEKDPSAPLGMTIRDNAHPTRLSSRCDANLRPFGAPPSKGRR